ncbi:: tRNA_anti-like [Gemmataceae bacterium]|nr:: tRNA_anti-like [Gemmataceae bacterium]VTU02753.1 : tRNA_anti-like [Gemmataceae bacterium]
MAGRYAQTRQRAGCGTNLFGGCGLGCVLVALLLVVGVAWLSANRDKIRSPNATSPSTEPASGELDVKVLIAEQLADSDAASRKYFESDRLMVVRGKVTSSEWHTRRHEGVYVVMTVDGGHQLAATFKAPNEQDAALRLKPGDYATVKGRLLSSGRLGPGGAVVFMLTKCELLSR